MSKYAPKEIKRGFFLDGEAKELPPPTEEERIEQEQNTRMVEQRDALTDLNDETPKGLPVTLSPPCVAPELKQAQQDAAEAELEATATLRPARTEAEMDEASSIDPEDKAKAQDKARAKAQRGARTKQRSQSVAGRVEKELSVADWEAVAEAFSKTGNPKAIAKQTHLTEKQVEHLLNNGLNNHNLPSIIDTTVNKGEAIKAARHMAQKNQAALFSDDVATAIQKRATQEAAAANAMLQQTIQTGNMVTGYVKALMERLSTGQSELIIPEEVTLDTFDTVTKVVDAHTRAMERAIKMVRLTQGEPTELIEHQIGAMLAVCTTRELEEAATSGNLPRRLTSRLSGADPVQAESTVIDVDYTDQRLNEQSSSSTQPTQQTNPEQPRTQQQNESQETQDTSEPDEPEWLKSIAPPEGMSQSDTTSEKLQSLDEIVGSINSKDGNQ